MTLYFLLLIEYNGVNLLLQIQMVNYIISRISSPNLFIKQKKLIKISLGNLKVNMDHLEIFEIYLINYNRKMLSKE